MDQIDNKKQDFHLGADVFSIDGKHVGKLKRMLVDQSDYKLRALVVAESGLFSGRLLSPGSAMIEDDLVVPTDAVRQLTGGRVDLALTAAQTRRLPPYLSYRRFAPSAGQELQGYESALGGNPAIPTMEEIAAKPNDEIEIDAGENVMLGHSGQKLGHVKDVLFDETELIGIVVEPRGFFTKPVVVPRRFLGRSDDLALFVDISEEEVKDLETYESSD